ncbi:hypothetical protein CRUP_038111 [Coryphaenoides rupestris]|nr:hypothetical protein CRUP_038111 [Coryphaenoides rupestris]
MVQMMESQCEYFMYFPAVPISDLSDPARYRTLPRRSHLYLGETVRFLLVLRCKDASAGATPTDVSGGAAAWASAQRDGQAGGPGRELAGSLLRPWASASSPGEGSRPPLSPRPASPTTSPPLDVPVVSTTLTVLPPPTVRCKQMTVSGKHLTVLKVLNESSQEERNMTYLFQLHLNDSPQDDSKEVTQHPSGSTSVCDDGQLPEHRQGEGALRVKYVLLNNLQDFLAVRLVWTPDGRGHCDEADLGAVVCHTPLSNLGHCRKGSTLSFTVAFQILKPGLYEVENATQLMLHQRPQKTESAHELKLQFTASVTNPPPDARPLSRKNSPSSPAVRDLPGPPPGQLGEVAVLLHQQPSRSHIMRRHRSPAVSEFCRVATHAPGFPFVSSLVPWTGSAMERRAITPPVGSPVGRPLYLPPPDKAVLSLDKIAKRECKVLVLDPIC